MATKKPAAPPEGDAAAQTDDTPPPAEDRRTLAKKAADAVAELPDYSYAEFQHDGQAHVAWRSRNGTVHIENRGL